MKIYISAIFTALCLSSCIVDHGDFTVLSNKPLDAKKISRADTKRFPDVKGIDMLHSIMIIPMGGRAKLSEALNDALEENDSDAMTNVSVTSWHFAFSYFYSNKAWLVSGDTIKTREAPASL